MPQPDPLVPAEPEPGPPATAAEPEPVPSEAELASTATPGTVRRAPKFGAFLVAGGLVGAVVGLLVAGLAPGDRPDGSGFLPFLDGVNAVRTWLAVAGLVLGILVGGLLAALADRRSVRRARRPRP
ncbi:histidine kinase [Cellulomonas alba]|uniref:Histidine kinase n=1 Tax=Cellulomonas alba TaxID=3053467 RepID=A0ABT7SEN8_9CELL|nr:histidine kinase [Cellulomonas alba]MDM7854596.1 histidine kinase [Cellulomonas alba]